MAGGVFSYGSSTQLKGNAKAAPATNPDGEATGKCFGFFGVWGCGGYYYQSVTLNPGNYTITVPMYNQSGTQQNTTYTGFFPTSGTNRTVAVNPTVGSWANQTVSFELTEATEGQIRIGYQSTGSGSGANPHIFIDRVTIICTDFKAELRAVIAQAQAINARISTLSDDITTAQGVLNTASASKTTIDDAVTTLRSAISTKLAAYTGLNAAGDDITSFIANNGFETSPTFDGTSLGSGSDPKSNATPTAGSTLLLNAKNVYQINGWELLTTETSDFARTFTMPYNTTLNVWGNNNVAGQAVTSPANGSSVTESNEDLLFVEANWCENAVLGVKQTLPLPAGSYRLTFDSYVTNAIGNAESRCGVSYGETTDYKWPAALNTWTANEVDFTLDEQKNVTISMGYKKIGNVGGGSSAFLFVDNVKLTYFDPLKLAQIQWQEVHDALAALDATALPDAAEAAITTELAKSVPTTSVDDVNDAKDALQALIDSYAGIKAAYDEYKALKASVSDLMNTSKYTFTGADALSTFNSTLSTIDGNAEDATDATTLTDLLPSLKTAGNTFVGNIVSNDGFDLTYNIINNSFETGALSPWTTNGSNDTGVKPNSNGTYTTTGVDGSYLFNTWNNGAGSKVSQTVTDLPTGYYTVTALVASDAGNTINILAGATTKTIDADATDGKTVFVEGTTDKTLVSEGSLEIGTNSATWYKSDYFRLTYYTVKAGAAEAWAAAKAAAEAARDNSDYDNVTGAERTALLAEIAKEEPTTAEAYGTATTALQEATSAFIAAKDSYDGLIAKRTEASAYTTVAWPYASTAKKTALDNAVAAAPTNAEDAVTKTNAITTAIRQFVESSGVAEGVAVAVSYASAIAGADPDVNTGWTNGIGVDNRDQEKYTDGSGNTSGKYYDGGWSTNAGANINMSRTVTLPAGQYLLQVTARGSENLTTYTMSIGGESVDLPKQGSGANVGTFGHGWSDKYIVFTSDGTDLTLTFAATSTEYQQWISFNRLRLTKLDATLATAEDYENLNNAIAAAEANLGFEDGQNAPYNNVASMELLAAAKAIDQTINNVQSDVQDATTALTGATWTANAEDVNAIFNGMFDSDVEGDWGLTGWTRTNAWGQQQTGLSGDYATAYYNQPGSLKYGNTGVYTMPLKGNTIYKLTFAYRSHENNSNKGMTVSVLKGEEGLTATAFPANGSTSEWKVVSKRFKTGSTGNYILTLANSGNTWMTNVSLVKDENCISEEDTWVPLAKASADVTLTRTLSKDYWNTFSVPFDAAIPSGWTVKKFVYESSEVIYFDNAESIEAGKPYLVKPDADVANPTFNNVIVKSIDGSIDGTGDYQFAAQIYNKELPTDGTIAYLSTDHMLKRLTSGGIKGLRAYFIIPANSNGARISFGNDDTTGISSIDNGKLTKDETIYDLQGRKVTATKKGIYVVNGKKVIK